MKFSEIQDMVARGLVTPEQGQDICASYGLREHTKHNYLMMVLSFLGGLLILWGLIMIISSNWDFIPRGVRMGGGIGIMVGLWIGALYLIKNTEYGKIGGALCFVAAGMWGANIALYSQLYQVTTKPSLGVALFFGGIVGIPFLLKSRAIFIMAFVTGLFLIGMLISDYADWMRSHHAIFCYFGYLALVYFGGAFMQRCRDSFVKDYAPWALSLGLFGILIMGYIFCYEEKTCEPELFNIYGASILLVVTACLFLILRKKPQEHALSPNGYISACVALCTVSVGLQYYIAGQIALTLAAGLLMYSGFKTGKTFPINLGCVVVVLLLIALLTNVLDRYDLTGSILVVAGVIFLILAIVLEKQRRRLVTKARERNASFTSFTSTDSNTLS